MTRKKVIKKDEWLESITLAGLLVILLTIPPFIPLASEVWSGFSVLFTALAGCSLLSIVVLGSVLTELYRAKTEKERLIVKIQELWQELLEKD